MLLYNRLNSIQDKRNPFNDTISQERRDCKILGKFGKKAELYNKYSASFHLKSKNKTLLTGTSKTYCQRRISSKVGIPNQVLQGLYLELILHNIFKVNAVI